MWWLAVIVTVLAALWTWLVAFATDDCGRSDWNFVPEAWFITAILWGATLLNWWWP